MNINKRKLAREHMMKVLFQMDARDDFKANDRNIYMEKSSVNRDKKYCEKILVSYIDSRKEIDEIISKSTKEWDISRMAKVDLAIIRLAISEIKFCDDIAPAISINEAVNLAKTYGTESSPSFVNAILGGALKEIEG
ncbi:transcription antitermination factor NusB [Eubacteriales bacterium KG125]